MTTSVHTLFELDDGRILECDYYIVYTPASYYYEGDTDVSEPVYHLDGQEIEVDAMPKGLAHMAERLYNAGHGQFGYTEVRNLRDDIEPDEPDYWD